jgi:hypothetical protein
LHRKDDEENDPDERARVPPHDLEGDVEHLADPERAQVRSTACHDRWFFPSGTETKQRSNSL